MIESYMEINKCRFLEPPDCKLIFTKYVSSKSCGDKKSISDGRLRVCRVVTEDTGCMWHRFSGGRKPIGFFGSNPNYLEYSGTLSSAVRR